MGGSTAHSYRYGGNQYFGRYRGYQNYDDGNGFDHDNEYNQNVQNELNMNNSDARFQLARHYRNELWRDQERKSRIYYAKQKEKKQRQDIELHHIAVKDLIKAHKHNKVLING